MARYILEAVLYDGQRLLSDTFERESPFRAESLEVYELRRGVMVETVAAIDLRTGEVVLDMPSFACLARCSSGRVGTVGSSEVPVISKAAA